MKPLEGLAPTQTEIEKAKQEIVLKPLEIKVAEISNEEIEQHTIYAELHIEQQTADILPEGVKRMESSISSINVSPETLDSTKQEFGLDVKLQEVQAEAEQIANEAKSEIASVAEKPKQDEPKIQENWPSNETQKPAPKIENRPTGKLSEVFEKAGLESRVVKIENGGEFSEAIIIDKKESSPEKMVRLYRGINHLDASVLEQIPYAMRKENGTGKLTTLESVRQEVDTLAKNPTYENLLAYIDKVRQHLSPQEAHRLDEDFARIEDGILDGYSTRKELIFKQIEHNGGWGERGISPYISTSFDPYEAAGYGDEGLIIMDVPLSQIEDFRADTTEANIKGALDKKYITAILIRKREGVKEKEQLKQEIYQALQKVYEIAPANLYSDEELRAERQRKLTKETDSDKEQWNKDVEAIRQKRVAKLTRRFPEVKLDLQSSPEKGVDIYTKVKRDIFDFYKSRLEKIGRNGRDIEDYKYQEKEYGEQKKFDREKTSDTMLLKLRALVEHLEEKEEERNRR